MGKLSQDQRAAEVIFPNTLRKEIIVFNKAVKYYDPKLTWRLVQDPNQQTPGFLELISFQRAFILYLYKILLKNSASKTTNG